MSVLEIALTVVTVFESAVLIALLGVKVVGSIEAREANEVAQDVRISACERSIKAHGKRLKAAEDYIKSISDDDEDEYEDGDDMISILQRAFSTGKQEAKEEER